MIIVDLVGQLGNQLFQYAFATTVAEREHTQYVLNPIYKNEIVKYFYLDFFTHFFYILFRNVLYKKLLLLLKKINKMQMIEQDDGIIDIKTENNIHYCGFFQSEQFFLDCKEEIIKRFAIKKKYHRKFQKKFNNLYSNNKIIVLHIRRTDYLIYGDERRGGKNLCLPMSYYEDCLRQISNLTNYKMICVSDDIEYCKEYFKGRDFIFEQNETIIDFQILKYADIAIIANSSFSWWAAYLNNKPNKIVYAPKYWLGFKINKEYPMDIIPNNFIKIPVFYKDGR